MANPIFEITKGIYEVPNFGKVDLFKKQSRRNLVALAINPRFPFIKLNENSAEALKKEKVTEKDVVSLIQQADTIEQIDWLLDVKSSDPVIRIAELKKKALL